MKRLLFALGALTMLTVASTPSLAAITPTPGQILAQCPDIRQAKACTTAAESFLVGERFTDDVIAVDIAQRNGVAGCGNVITGNFADRLDGVDDDGELAGHPVQLLAGHVDVGKPCQMRDVLTGDLGHVSPGSRDGWVSGSSLRAGGDSPVRLQPKPEDP